MPGANLSSPDQITIADGFAYIANAGSSSVTICSVTADYTLTACARYNNAALPGASFNANSGIAVIGTQMFVANGSSSISYCALSGSVPSGCANYNAAALAGSGISTPFYISIINSYLFMANSGNSTLGRCMIGGGGSLSGCTNWGNAQFSGVFNSPVAEQLINGQMYIVNNGNSSISRCSYDVATGNISACVNQSNANLGAVLSSPYGIVAAY